MSKNKVRIIQMETVLIAILLICTLANLLTNKMFTAVLLVVSAIVFINLIKKKRILRVNKKKIVIVLLLFGLFYFFHLHRILHRLYLTKQRVLD